MHLSKEVKIGLIAVIVLLLSVWGFNYLKGKNILKPTDEYYLIFDRIDGLIESGMVSYKGYKVGNIASIKFDSRKSGKFILRIVLEEKLNIPKDSYIKTKSSNPLVATSDLELIFGNADEYLHPGDTILTRTSRNFSDILEPLEQKLNTVMNGIDSLVISINSVLTPESEANLRNSLANLDKSLLALRSSLGPDGSLYNSLANLEAVTSNLNKKNPQIASGIEHLANVSSALDSANLDKTIQDLDSTLVSLQAVIEKMNAGEGTMGKLVNDSNLYTNLDSTTYHLNQLMKDLKENPKRYVHFSLFGKKDN